MSASSGHLPTIELCRAAQGGNEAKKNADMGCNPQRFHLYRSAISDKSQ